ncbi:unnamed protein product [Gongylonema pulchrum]|uniref:Tudor domain-containing protein n=1 Tax=Gongylonema pulchrum TaxID=637853 RepID=A0A183EQJ0_9BILA|nr:unnamed protein product [Gongylonema pulchrum]
MVRCDDDNSCALWPLFFVHINSKENRQLLDRYFSSMTAIVPLLASESVQCSFTPNSELGTLCIAYCEKYNAKLRALITTIGMIRVEVFYVDYGIFEWVDRTHLYSIIDQELGTLCIAYCEKYSAKLRALITTIGMIRVEVFYVDYGIFEWVDRTHLYSIIDQVPVKGTSCGAAVFARLALILFLPSFISFSLSNLIRLF